MCPYRDHLGFLKCTNVIPIQRLVNFNQLEGIFEKLTAYFERRTSKQLYTETDSLISKDFALEVLYFRGMM